MKRYQVITAVFWILLSLFIMLFSYRLGLEDFHNPGPGLMAFLVGGLLLLVSLYHLVTLVYEKEGKDEAPKTKSNPDFKKISLVIISLFAYAVLLEILGYLITTCILLIPLFRIMGSRWSVVFAASILTALVTYFGFIKLGVILPVGILTF